MKALKQRDAEAGLEFHREIVPRIYAGDEVQRHRIGRSREMVAWCIGADYSRKRGLRIVELGCGTMDISGPFSKAHTVYGVECNEEAVRIAAERWPDAHLNVVSLQPESCDVLILCEFLEHIPDPLSLVKAWLPLAEQVVISHPLNGDLKEDLSGGEHQWSFDAADFERWFEIGGHKLIESEVFKMEGYDIILGRGQRVDPAIYATRSTQ
jgi:trans-aconitate methyltransferase